MIYIDLKQIRADNGEMKQSELAEKLGCEQSYVSQVESGKRRMSDEMLEKIKQLFGDITAYMTDVPEKTFVQKNSHGDNIVGDKILLSQDAERELILRLQAENARLKDEVEWLRSIVEKRMAER